MIWVFFFQQEDIYLLVGVPLESIRLRFALLQSLNNTLETFYLPLVDLRPAQIYNRSTAALLSMLRGLVFYDTKINLMNRVLNATEQRKPDQAAPEITLDPLETILSKKYIDRQSDNIFWYLWGYSRILTKEKFLGSSVKFLVNFHLKNLLIQLMYGYSFEKRISLLKCYTMLIQNKWQVYYCGICTYYIINNFSY